MKKIIFTIVVIFFITALIFLLNLNNSDKILNSNEKNSIYIVNHGWHTSIVLPSEIVFKKLPPLKERFSNSEYLEFGWGDEKFYRADNYTVGLTLRAILWPTSSVLHVVGLHKNVKRFFFSDDVKRICIDDEGLQKLAHYICSSFYMDKNKKLVTIGKGLYGEGYFYKSNEKYFLTKTCNYWTAKGLSLMGFDIFPIFNQTSKKVMSNIKSVNSCKE
jgi:uncharacterized protein (TIGR02117 family)